MSITAIDVETMARTVYGEARGETALGKKAVAHVIINRMRKGGWWGRTISQVCLHPRQFSAWNQGDPNRTKMTAVDLGDSVYRECMYASLAALRDEDNDPTGGACHYHTNAVYPGWARDKPYSSIGNHKFYVGLN